MPSYPEHAGDMLMPSEAQIREDAERRERCARLGVIIARDFNPDQPRDPKGEWTSGGGDEEKPPEPALKEQQETFLQAKAESKAALEQNIVALGVLGKQALPALIVRDLSDERSLCPACECDDCVRHQLSIEQLGGEKMALRGWISWPSFEARFSEDQPRDDKGRWSASAGGQKMDAAWKETTTGGKSFVNVKFSKDGETLARINAVVQGKTLKVNTVGVNKDQQGKGIGKELYRQLFAQAEKHGYDTVRSSPSRLMNEASIGVWKSLQEEYPIKTIGTGDEQYFSLHLGERALRFDPDQHRDPDGKFASGKASEETITVYHGKALGADTTPMHPKGFYVTADKAMAEKYFGDVHQVDVKRKDLIPDPEQEGQAGKKLSGEESLKLGSALVPHEYYGSLTKVSPKSYKSSALGRVTIPERSFCGGPLVQRSVKQVLREAYERALAWQTHLSEAQRAGMAEALLAGALRPPEVAAARALELEQDAEPQPEKSREKKKQAAKP